ncbi:SIMPL domain-containing protein [Deinococcus radiotolerans]|uniref:SIMPL domain-containing protein n=1 Tax=Deinococcus radiotolerans TaxID=1309407 RepID=A0ABQ2FNX5_9DEIO|nr:SIMPL domain-containing protein [Deinococcus radiotolerans]GGL12400.1 hypothetical protein GCM10010844_33860 [Deinococcus radiotolerans]
MAEYAIIERPVGVSVFGSSLKRVPPDRAVLHFVVRHTDPDAKQAYARTQADMLTIAAHLNGESSMTYGQSGIELYLSERSRRDESSPAPYTARVNFEVHMTDLTRLESLMADLVALHVHHFTGTHFTTTGLRDIRQQVRREAVWAAREKAMLYAEEAGVLLGRLLHIQDLNPDQLRRHNGHISEPIFDELLVTPDTSLHPNSVTVGAAVTLVYALN